jgi:hypothetical protein
MDFGLAAANTDLDQAVEVGTAVIGKQKTLLLDDLVPID